MAEDISYQVSSDIDVEALMAFYERQQHPVSGSRRMLAAMIERTFCIVTARRGGELIGMARGLCDGQRGYLAECKLDPAFQGPACITRRDGRIEHDSGGIARAMATRVIAALEADGVEVTYVLAHGTEVDFCEELGFKQVAGAVCLARRAVPANAAAQAGAGTTDG